MQNCGAERNLTNSHSEAAASAQARASMPPILRHFGAWWQHFSPISLDFAALSRLESSRFQEAFSRIGGPGVSSSSRTFAYHVLEM